MKTLEDFLPESAKADPVKREARLVEAYTAFIDGRASKDDAGLILIDLAKESGYFHVTPPGTPVNDVLRHEGGRAVFGRIAYLTNLPFDVVSALQMALIKDSKYQGDDV